MEIAIVLLPVMMIVIGVYRIMGYASQLKKWIKSEGEVVAFLHQESSRDAGMRVYREVSDVNVKSRLDLTQRHYYSAIIGYWLNEEKYEIIYYTKTPEALPFVLGEKVIVLVNPKQPTEAKVGDNISQLWHPLTILIMGVLALLAISWWWYTQGS
ncbi:MAG TPA: DUF3592 domain-containing protein [Phnomibacter sp.]|nr:DUF3592 domain-containing protein [Phnomibacter sp.]